MLGAVGRQVVETQLEGLGLGLIAEINVWCCWECWKVLDLPVFLRCCFNVKVKCQQCVRSPRYRLKSMTFPESTLWSGARMSKWNLDGKTVVEIALGLFCQSPMRM